MHMRIGARSSRSAWGTLFVAACLAVWLPLQAAEPVRDAAPPADGVNRAQIEQRIRAAQQRLEQAAREMAELSVSLGEEGVDQVRRMTRTFVQRAMLGMSIDMRDPGPGGEGVRVVSVSPGGAAEVAGIRANDIVMSLDGKALRGEAGRPPQQQLLDITRDAAAGASMAIEYRRDGKVTKTQIVPRSMSESFADIRIPDVPGGERMLRFLGRGPGGFGATELVELTPALGGYFGAEKGLLVVRAPSDQRFKLQDGDVIQDIDGRVPTGVAHAFQILESYRPGETVKLHILRQKKRMELAVEIPQAASRPMTRPVPGTAAPPAPPARGPTVPAAPTRREST